MDKVRVKFLETNLPKYLWGKAIKSSACELNRYPSSANNGLSPAQIWYQKEYLGKLRVFGSQAFTVTLPKRNKLDVPAERLIMVEYNEAGYRVWNSKEIKIISARDITFDEENVRFDKQQQKKRNKKNQEMVKHLKKEQKQKKILTNNSEEEINNEEANPDREAVSRIGRKVKLPSHLNKYKVYTAYCLLYKTLFLSYFIKKLPNTCSWSFTSIKNESDMNKNRTLKF